MSLGWNSKDHYDFEQLIIKANDEQLNAVVRRVKLEKTTRHERADAMIAHSMAYSEVDSR